MLFQVCYSRKKFLFRWQFITLQFSNFAQDNVYRGWKPLNHLSIWYSKKKVYARNNHISRNRRFFYIRFIVTCQITIPACSEKGTFHCLAKRNRRRGIVMKEIIFFEREAEGGAHEAERERERECGKVATRGWEEARRRTQRWRKTVDEWRGGYFCLTEEEPRCEVECRI